ncbi:methyltransferase family protein [Tumebacillus sp. BK434]|uniref:class I SAM-dependent methyltransferase n=1 Tax=Tumebacillus sp. BK434 TaxID=2512169 RepID=UPI0010E08A03|nr:class I SAM-dependent methyltransferase [Tumebacillus sp. BK434]TCP52538.1 methyltransferase family protein [Tumebacillus sp. BK434]
MSAQAGSFEQYVSAYEAKMSEPWGVMFYDILYAQLGNQLDADTQTALVVGSGLGTLDRWLAGRGLQVTGTDVAPAMVAYAQQKADAAGLAINYQVHDVLTGTMEEQFDLIVCHNVLEYVAMPDFAVANLASWLQPGGKLSLVLHNPVNKVLKAAVQGQDPLKALELLDRREFHFEMMNATARNYTLAEAANWLNFCGFDVLEHYGVRTVYDLIPNEPKSDPAWHQNALQMELVLSTRSPYKEMAMFNHLIARKR